MATTMYDLIQQQKGNPLGTTHPDVKTNTSELDKRMQTDVELLHLDKYIMRDSKGVAIPDIINVTLNRPAVFAAQVFSSLANAKQQCIVESDDKKVDTHLIESFLDGCMAAADRRLRRRGMPTLNPFADVQFCIRGRHARRVLLRQEGDAVVSDIMPWDGRYVYYEQGEDGLKWAAYECIRSRDEVIADYGEVAAAKAVNNECAVVDAWDDKVNEIWIDGAKVQEVENPYGFCPVVMQIVPLGFGAMLLDRNWHKYDGESIFFMIRDIVPELNRLVSMLQTLNMNQVKAALQYRNPEGTPSDEPPDRPEMGDIISVGKGQIEPINLGEARVAAQMVLSIMDKAFQEGAYSDIDLGTVQQPFSAVALVTIGENKDMVHMPRLAAKELLNTDTAEMLIRQALHVGGTLSIGTPGHETTYATPKLKGKYDISYKYFVKSPKIDIARMSLADAAAKWYPRQHIYQTVLQVEDPDGMTRDWYSELAEQLSPTVRQYRVIRSLLERAEKNNDEDAAREAQLIALEQGLNIEQIKRGVMPAAPQQQTAQSPEGLALMPPSGKVKGGIGAPISRPQEVPMPPVTMPRE